MDHFGLPIARCDVLFLERATRKHTNAISVNHHVVFAFFQIKGGNLRFPKLEGLVSEERPWVLARYINHINVVSVNVDRLVTDD
jgi:hypothetical protein